MQNKKIYRDYSNSKIIPTAILSLLCAAVMLLLFIIFVSTKRPSFRELSKYVFVTMILDFVLLIAYGICTFLKDSERTAYALKILACAGVVLATIFILNTIALHRHHARPMPVFCLCFSFAVAFIDFFVCLEYFLHDTSKQDDHSIFLLI